MKHLENWYIQVDQGHYKEPKMTGSPLKLYGNYKGQPIEGSKILSLDLKERLAPNHRWNLYVRQA